jgi:hypothetical protein
MSRSQYYESPVRFTIPLTRDIVDHGWEMVGVHMPTYERVYSVRYDIGEWIETQPSHLWKSYEVDHAVLCYILSEELLSWMILKWR